MTPGIVQALSNAFIPVAVNLEEVYSVNAPGNVWLRQVIQTTNPTLQHAKIGSAGATTQGYYMVGPDGTGYGFGPPANKQPFRSGTPLEMHQFALAIANEVFQEMRDAFARFQAHPPSKIDLKETEINAAETHSALPTTSVIRVIGRVLSPDQSNPVYNSPARDYFWVYQNEVDDLLTAADVATEKTGNHTFGFPAQIAARLTRFQLGDPVGQMIVPWRKEEVKKAQYVVKEVRSGNESRKFTFDGSFDMAGSIDEGWTVVDRRFAGTIYGEFEVNPTERKITRFRAFAEGMRLKSADNRQQPVLPLALALIEDTDSEARILAPNGLVWSPHFFKNWNSAKEYRYPAGALAPQRITSVQGAGQYPIADIFNKDRNAGIWTFGSLSPGDVPDTSSFRLYEKYTMESGGVDCWQSPNGRDPCVTVNRTDKVLAMRPTLVWTPGMVQVHPGPQGHFSVARWKAPNDGVYSVSARFWGADQAGVTSDVHVLYNGQSLFSALVNGFGEGEAQIFTKDVAVSGGSTLDFVVGWGANKAFANDSTALDVRITRK